MKRFERVIFRIVISLIALILLCYFIVFMINFLPVLFSLVH